ncbi:MAG: Fur family transcriptional regulator [Christensenellales bacterium]|jgi:Fur family peroxide stress response transcriptional regulator
MDSERIAEELKKRKVRPSYQRIRIYGYLLGQRSHPNVDEIFHALVEDIPTLSKTTVYNALNLFAKAELVRVVTIEDNEMRYDADMSVHGHFKCEACGAVTDFPLDPDAMVHDALEGYLTKERNVYFKGLCPRCNQGGVKHEKSERNKDG